MEIQHTDTTERTLQSGELRFRAMSFQIQSPLSWLLRSTMTLTSAAGGGRQQLQLQQQRNAPFWVIHVTLSPACLLALGGHNVVHQSCISRIE